MDRGKERSVMCGHRQTDRVAEGVQTVDRRCRNAVAEQPSHFFCFDNHLRQLSAQPHIDTPLFGNDHFGQQIVGIQAEVTDDRGGGLIENCPQCVADERLLIFAFDRSGHVSAERFEFIDFALRFGQRGIIALQLTMVLLFFVNFGADRFADGADRHRRLAARDNARRIDLRPCRL